MNERVVFIDIETAGLAVTDPIIQVAACVVDGGWKEVESLEVKIQFDDASADPKSLAINRYMKERWKEAVPEAQALDFLSSLLRKYADVRRVSSRSGRAYSVARVGGYNMAFDTDRLLAMFKRHDAFFPADLSAALDVRYGAVWYFLRQPPAPKDFKQTTVAAAFGLDVSGAHDALVDVRLCVQIAERLLKA